MSFAEVINRIHNPAPNVLPYLEFIRGQLQVQLAAAPLEDGNSYATQLGTLTASRRNSKPFIVGFIPPDNEVNFIPVKRTFTNLAGISLRGQGGPSIGDVNSNAYLPPSKGKQKRQRQYVSTEELRQALIDGYVRFTGVLPDPNTLALMWAQKALENGLGGQSKHLGTWNNNLGSSHAGGRAGKYNKGADGKRDPKNGIEVPVVEPTSGTFYISDDHDHNGEPYPVAFHSFDNLSDASTYAIALLADKWPGALTATNSADYNSALLPNGFLKPGSYHVDKTYQRKLDSQVSMYNRRGFNDLPIESQFAQGVTAGEEGTEVQRSIMAAGGFTGTERDPKGDRIGRNIDVDKDRLAIVNLQTEALRQQIELIRNTPPLIMLINPSSFTRSHEQAVDSSPKTRHGHVVHAWLERPMKISCAGVTAGQYAMDYEGAGGLTNVNRVHSISYGNLLSLVNIYRNNGIVFSGPELKNERGIPIVPFTIFIYYDNHIYLGSFDDFGVEDSGDKPYNMSYNFSFTTRYDKHVYPMLVDASIAASQQY